MVQISFKSRLMCSEFANRIADKLNGTAEFTPSGYTYHAVRQENSGNYRVTSEWIPSHMNKESMDAYIDGFLAGMINVRMHPFTS